MTEKRFQYNVNKNSIEQNGKYFAYCNGEQTKIAKKLNELNNENEQLKQSSTLYYNLFKEFQKQMEGVKRASDLDSKDFDDLIELSKGKVFDDELGWIHFPIKELQEK